MVQDFGEDGVSENESDDEQAVSSEECSSASEAEDENEEEETKSDATEDEESDVQATAEEALKKLVPFNLDEFEKVLSLCEVNNFMAQRSAEAHLLCAFIPFLLFTMPLSLIFFSR